MRISHQNGEKFNSDSLRSWSILAPPRRTWLHLPDPLWRLPWIPSSYRSSDTFLLAQHTACPEGSHRPSLGHKVVHFGCCQDPNIYYLYPTVESWAVSTNLNSNSLGSFFATKLWEKLGPESHMLWFVLILIPIWNQDCLEEYQQPQICRWHHPYGRKQRETKKPLDEGKRRKWKRRLQT